MKQPNFNWGEPRPFSEAPMVEGTRLLAWCRAAESPDGWAEVICVRSDQRYIDEGDPEVHYQFVIDHPWANADPGFSHFVYPPPRVICPQP